MFKHNMLRVSTLLLALSLGYTAVAGEKDFDQPIKVDSKSNFFDGKTKTSIFKQDVRITQGSLVILAEEVEVIAGLGEGKEVFIARGTPAKYSQNLDDGSNISAAANEIRYEVNSRTLELSGDAELNQDSSLVRGESILFNMELEQLVAQGSEDSKGGVTAIFQPDSLRKNKEKDTDDTDKDNIEKQDEPH